ncbi:MAG: DUF2812 domain-containing protein [Gordonibacter sp.]|uniref:DUF2812 domain-containing protein n=1 Tax=Gordonibacter sp. TaxID=1968902 RepID=UPI002FC6962E
MRKTVHKVFWAWDFQKEEDWLNAQAAKGMNLVAAGPLSYAFEEGEPGVYTYRLELLDNLPWSVGEREYLRFMEDAGIEQVASMGRWVYFRKRTDGGAFELFSDIDSRIKHLRRIQLIALFALAAEFFAMVVGVPNLVKGSPEMALVVAVLVAALALATALPALRIVREIRRLKAERKVRE